MKQRLFPIAFCMFALCCMALPSVAWAEIMPPRTATFFIPAPAPKLEDMEMNGIRLKDYEDFNKAWRLVTVRYRTDTYEQRFVYANESAFKALLKGGHDYPDGAVFAKIGVMTMEDPDFASSKVPSGAARIQFMVKNAKRYASTDGWGYALFGPDGGRLDKSQPSERQAEACNACHQIVMKSRGGVFGQPMRVREMPMPPPPNATPPSGPERVFTSAQASFRDARTAALPESIRKMLPPRTPVVRAIEGSLRDHVFSGTLNEIRPLLTREALRSGKPALLLSRDEKLYTLVMPGAGVLPPCTGQQKSLKIYWSAMLHGLLDQSHELATYTETKCENP